MRTGICEFLSGRLVLAIGMSACLGSMSVHGFMQLARYGRPDQGTVQELERRALLIIKSPGFSAWEPWIHPKMKRQLTQESRKEKLKKRVAGIQQATAYRVETIGDSHTLFTAVASGKNQPRATCGFRWMRLGSKWQIIALTRVTGVGKESPYAMDSEETDAFLDDQSVLLPLLDELWVTDALWFTKMASPARGLVFIVTAPSLKVSASQRDWLVWAPEDQVDAKRKLLVPKHRVNVFRLAGIWGYSDERVSVSYRIEGYGSMSPEENRSRSAFSDEAQMERITDGRWLVTDLWDLQSWLVAD